MPHPLLARQIFHQRPAVAPAGGGGFAPSDIASLAIWNEVLSAYCAPNSGGSGLGTCTNGGTLAYVAGRGGKPNAIQSSGGNEPTFDTATPNGASFGSGKWLAFGDVAFTGALTVYGVFTRAAGENYHLLGHTTGQAHLTFYTDEVFYFDTDSNSYTGVAQTLSSGLVLARIRRDASDNVTLRGTGFAQATFGPKSGTVTYNNYGVGNSSGTTSTCRTHACVAFSADLGNNTTDDVNMRNYLVAAFGCGDLT